MPSMVTEGCHNTLARGSGRPGPATGRELRGYGADRAGPMACAPRWKAQALIVSQPASQGVEPLVGGKLREGLPQAVREGC